MPRKRTHPRASLPQHGDKEAGLTAQSSALPNASRWGSGRLPTPLAEDLSPTAVRLLEAARALLERSGYEGLRLEAISAESGLAHSLIRYHFGGKSGLVGALIDWCLHETYEEMHKDFSGLDPDDVEGGIRALSAGLKRLFESPLSYRLYLDLSVACLHDDKVRGKLADSFEGQRALVTESIREPIGVNGGTAHDLASVVCAFADGLALQYLADPNAVQLDGVFGLWDKMLRAVLQAGDGDAATVSPDESA